MNVFLIIGLISIGLIYIGCSKYIRLKVTKLIKKLYGQNEKNNKIFKIVVDVQEKSLLFGLVLFFSNIVLVWL